MKNEIITLTTNTYARASLIKTRLEDEGIECFLSNVNLVQPGVSFGVKIKIFEKDLTRALKIVREIEKMHGKDLIRVKKASIKISRMLVPVDFSDYSLNAAIFAIMLAEKLKAEVRLFHSFHNPMVDTMNFPDGYTYQTNMAEVYRELSASAKKNMKKFVSDLNSRISLTLLRSVKVKYKILAGVPSEEIITDAEKYNPDVIIIGTRGSGENPNEPIGNVTSSVMENTDIPVLVIPEKSSFSNTGESINILYTTEFDDSDPGAIKKLMAVISPFKFSITCVHVAPIVKDSLIIAKMKDLRAELKEMYNTLNLDCELIQEKDIFEGIKKVVSRKNIDMIALTHHKRNILYRILNPDQTKRILFKTEKPVLIFHA
jgi:nucleotide-binding universal stress UspA family protein